MHDLVVVEIRQGQHGWLVASSGKILNLITQGRSDEEVVHNVIDLYPHLLADWPEYHNEPLVILIPDDGWWRCECPMLPGCVTQGQTKREAVENVRDAMELCIEVRREMGMPDFESL